jgi:hypothetical protein
LDGTQGLSRVSCATGKVWPVGSGASNIEPEYSVTVAPSSPSVPKPTRPSGLRKRIHEVTVGPFNENESEGHHPEPDRIDPYPDNRPRAAHAPTRSTSRQASRCAAEG